MAALIECPGCGNKVWNKDPGNSIALGLSKHVLQNGKCPLCNNQISGWISDPAPSKKRISPKIDVNKAYVMGKLSFFIDRTKLRLRARLRILPTEMLNRERIDYYLFSHFAIPEFLLGPKTAVLALLDENIAKMVIKSIAKIVKDELNERGIQSNLEVESIKISTWLVNDDLCVVIHYPKPESSPEPYWGALLLRLNPRDLNVENLIKCKVNYLTLEKSDNNATYIGEWAPAGERKNHGDGPNPKLEDFLAYIERLDKGGAFGDLFSTLTKKKEVEINEKKEILKDIGEVKTPIKQPEFKLPKTKKTSKRFDLKEILKGLFGKK